MWRWFTPLPLTSRGGGTLVPSDPMSLRSTSSKTSPLGPRYACRSDASPGNESSLSSPGISNRVTYERAFGWWWFRQAFHCRSMSYSTMRRAHVYSLTERFWLFKNHVAAEQSVISVFFSPTGKT